MKKLCITAAMMAALALTTAAVALGDYEPPLPVTNITYNSVAKTVTLNWHDYSDIVGFKLYVATNLNESPVYWEALDGAKVGGITPRGTDNGDDVFDFFHTSVTVDGDITDKAFYRLMAVKGDGICTCGHCGEGGGTVCTHNYPVEFDGRFWTLVENTDYIYAEAYPDGLLKHPPYYLWSDQMLPNVYPPHTVIEPVVWDDPDWKGQIEYPAGSTNWVIIPPSVPPTITTPPGTPNPPVIVHISLVGDNRKDWVADYGYNNGTMIAAFIIYNDGSVPLSNVTASLASSADFSIVSGIPAGTSLAVGSSLTMLTVQPVAGRNAGFYSTSLTIDATELGTPVTVPLTFTVNKINQAGLFITSGASHQYDQFKTPYTIISTGGTTGNAVTYQIVSGGTGSGSISGNTLTISAAGTFILRATMAGNNNYNPVSSADFTLTVSPLPTDPSVTWGGVDHTIMIDLTNSCKVTRLPHNFDVSSDPAAKTYHLYMRHVTGGTFTMGAPSTELGYAANQAQKSTTVPGFYIGVYAVTAYQFDKINGGSPVVNTESVKAKEGDITNTSGPMSWNGIRGSAAVNGTAQGWMLKLENAVKAGNGGLSLGFDLPREAYWEYACRAGTQGTFSYQPTEIVPAGTTDGALLDTLGQYCWYVSNNSPYGIKEVGLKKANPAGLYDVHGNVYEWCLDAWDGSTALAGGNNPLSIAGSNRVRRSATFDHPAQSCRSAYRTSISPSLSAMSVGFRLSTVGGGNVVP